MKIPKMPNTLECFAEAIKDKKLILFGAHLLCMQCLNSSNTFLKKEDVAYIVDNNENLQGTKLYGLDILPPDSLKSEDPARITVCITAPHVKEIMRQVSSYGDFDCFTGRVLIEKVFLEVVKELISHKKELEQVYSSLYDERSKHIFKQVVYNRINGIEDYSDLQMAGERQYLLRDFFCDSSPDNEIIIDCGAYTGDTLKFFHRVFGGALKKYYAFEPMPESLEALQAEAMRLNAVGTAEIVVMPYGVSDKDEETDLYVSDAIRKNTASCIGSARPDYIMTSYAIKDKTTIRTVKLDEVIPAEDKVTMITMDIEGSEYPALTAAEKTIKAHKPRLAISIYHRGDDYFRIALLLKEFVPEYKLAIRHHFRGHSETVLYAWA